MKKRDIYVFFKKYFKLPRPNELWGEEVKNSWTLGTIYLYFKLCISELMSHIGLFLSLLNNLISLLIYLQVKDIGTSWVTIGASGGAALFLMFLSGHLLVVLGVTKKGISLGNSQNKELMEVLRIVKRIELK